MSEKLRYARCIRSDFVSQKFGEDLACVYSNGRVVNKSKGICPEGSISLYKKLGLSCHNGTDRPTWFKEPVYFSIDFDGWIKTEKDIAGGLGADIISNKPLLKCIEPNCNEIHYIKQRLWHAHSFPESIWDGKEVKWGEFVAYADSTGASSGNHVHEGIKWCDEFGNGIHKNNGYYGAFDINKHPDVEIIDEFVVEFIKREAEIKGIEASVKEVQLTLIQILTKYIFMLQEQVRQLVKVGLDLLK